MRGNTGKGRLSGAGVAGVLRHYPIWALSNLTVAKFVPPEFIFDYVVIDEASQCDIGSALPLLARARRAVVVGDPAQLRVVSTLSPDWEVELLELIRIVFGTGHRTLPPITEFSVRPGIDGQRSFPPPTD